MLQSTLSPEKILRCLEWTVIKRLDGLLQGDYRTLFHGFGLDFADLREYQTTDDIRYIDWNVTARMQVPYVRQYTEDRELNAWFLLDLSPSMDFGTINTFKLNMLVDFFIVLARLLTRHGNRVGAILYNGKDCRVIPPSSGKLQLLRLINDIIDQPRLTRAPQTDLNILVQKGLRVIRRRSLIFILSDFISTPGWDRPLGVLTQRHEVLGVRLYDPREMELPDIGNVIFEDAEIGEQIFIDTHDKKFRKRFREAAQAREYEINLIFHRVGIDVLPLSTEDDLVRQIIRFATIRKQRKLTPASFR